MPDPREAPTAPPSGRAVLWTVVPIALGLLVLLGGAVVGGVFAWRQAKSAGLAGASSPASAAPLPLPPPAAASPPGAAPATAGRADDAEPSAPVLLPPSATGERFRQLETTALLPVAGGDTIWGDANALVTVALFGDLECLHTRAALGAVARLGTRFGAKLRLVFHHRPVTERPTSLSAGRAVAALTLQRGPDLGWQVLAAAASSKTPATAAELRRWLDSAGVTGDTAEFSADPAALAQVEADAVLSALLQVQATPTLFVNGRRVIGEHSDELLARVVEDEMRAVRWLRAQRVSAEESYVRRVKANLIGVADGAVNRACVPVDMAPSEGSAPALVTLVEFSDFECEHCRDLEPVLSKVMARHPGSLRRVWRSFVIQQHQHAARSAAFALAARKLGGERAFWAVHGALLSTRVEELDDARLSALAKGLGLDGALLLNAASDPEHVRRLGIDQELAQDLGLRGTPTVFINGRELAGAVSFATLDTIVREELAAAQRIIKAGTPLEKFERVLCE